MALVRDGKISILSNRLYVISQDMDDDVFGLPGNVFSNPLEMIAERGFPLMRRLNVLINRMLDAGLITKIYNDFLFKNFVLDFIKQRHRIKVDEGHVTLSIDHLQGAFAVIIVGLLISFVAFLTEVIWRSRWFVMQSKNLTNRIENSEVYKRWMCRFMFKKKKKKKLTKLRKRHKKLMLSQRLKQNKFRQQAFPIFRPDLSMKLRPRFSELIK